MVNKTESSNNDVDASEHDHSDRISMQQSACSKTSVSRPSSQHKALEHYVKSHGVIHIKRGALNLEHMPAVRDNTFHQKVK